MCESVLQRLLWLGFCVFLSLVCSSSVSRAFDVKSVSVGFVVPVVHGCWSGVLLHSHHLVVL